MTPLSLDTLSSTCCTIDAPGDEHIVRLQNALKNAKNHAVFGIKTAHPQAEIHLREFCESSGNDYLGHETFPDHAVHYVKKRAHVCRTCSNMRVVLLVLALLGTLAYTAPQVLNANPSGVVVVMFISAIAFLPPVLFNSFRLLKRALKKNPRTPRPSSTQ